MENYLKIIKDNKESFNDADNLLDFIDSYKEADTEFMDDLGDFISEYADNLVPIYNNDIVKEWQDITDCQEMTLEVCGEYNQREGIYRMMASDLYFYYEQQLREDYDKLISLIEDEEDGACEGDVR